jgi:allophanate hydrolase
LIYAWHPGGALSHRQNHAAQRAGDIRQRAQALNPEFRLFIHILSEEEQEPFLAALDGLSPAALPLYGVPFAIKDNIDLAEIVTTAACPAFAYRAEQSATIVAQLIALGAAGR